VKAREQAPPFYRGWAALLEEALREAARRVGDGVRALPTALEEATADQPAAGGGATGDPPNDLPRLLTTPVRSGLILTRADLARASRARGLPVTVRIGERRFALDAMLGAAPSETLGWLAEEADAWAERHRPWAPPDPASARWWEERARRVGKTLAGLQGDRGRSALV